MKYNRKPDDSFRLPRNKILRKNDIKLILNSGIKEDGKYLSIFYQKSTEEKFAVLVSKKSGSAVDRNRGKRVAREIYRSNPAWFHNMRIVFLLKQVTIDHDALGMEIKKLLSIR
jgi:ribonuclease P protein component